MKLIALFWILLVSISSAQDSATPEARIVPETIRIEASEPRKNIFNQFPAKTQQLAYHLHQAALAGDLILFDQSHRHGLTVRSLLRLSCNKINASHTKYRLGEAGYREWVTYGTLFMEQRGPYHPSNRKYVLTKVTAPQVEGLLSLYLPYVANPAKQEIIQLLTDPAFEVMQRPGADGKGLENTGGNLYQHGITGEEVAAAVKKGLDTKENTRVYRSADGSLAAPPITTSTNNFEGRTLRKIVQHLEAAKPHASSEHQGNQIAALIRYLKSGKKKDFDDFNIAWLKDGTSSELDFMMSWVETYEDYRGKIGSWQTNLVVADPEISQVARDLAKEAQYFEDALPYDDSETGKSYRKKFEADYAPPAMLAYYFYEGTSIHTGGFNLPNDNAIRVEVGSKNVIKLPLPGVNEDPQSKANIREAYEEYLPASKVDAVLATGQKNRRTLVLFHEILGHGSGDFDREIYKDGETPSNSLGSLGASLEEQRADLAALIFQGDKKLVEIGIYETQEEATRMRNLTYDKYLGDMLLRISSLKNIEQTHTRGRWLYVNYLLNKGAIHWVDKTTGQPSTQWSKAVLAVKDYDQVHKLSIELMNQLQIIKARKQIPKMEALFDQYSNKADITQPWAQAIIQRGLDLKVNAGWATQPYRIRSTAAGLKLDVLGGKSPTVESVAQHWSPDATSIEAEQTHCTPHNQRKECAPRSIFDLLRL